MAEFCPGKKDEYKDNSSKRLSSLLETNDYLCMHCKRTKDNKIRCLGICVSDSDY